MIEREPRVSVVHVTSSPSDWREAYSLGLSNASDPAAVQYILACEAKLFPTDFGVPWEVGTEGIDIFLSPSDNKEETYTNAAACAFGKVVLRVDDAWRPEPGWDK
jgi:hypothetical protein